jgi:iron uptake system EfeUOB component EfeO/EfeM
MRRAILIAAALGLLAPSAQAAEVDAEAFRPFAAGLIDQLMVGAERLAGSIETGDLEAAKSDWIAARVGWERGETFLGEYFPDADEAIDSWPDAKSGFHAIEPLLFQAGDVAGAKALSERLLAEIEALRDGFAAQKLDSQALANGMTGIAYEIGEAKAGGGESPFAGTSLLDMRDNLQGIEALYALVFARAVERQDTALHQRVVGRMVELGGALGAPSTELMDQSRVMALSEQLAGDLQDVAQTVGLERPELGG